jgi:hypothetical protein
MKLSKKEKELLVFAGNTSIGTIHIGRLHDSNGLAKTLTEKGLMFKHEDLPYSTENYWTLTDEGHKVAEKVRETSKVTLSYGVLEKKATKKISVSAQLNAAKKEISKLKREKSKLLKKISFLEEKVNDMKIDLYR